MLVAVGRDKFSVGVNAPGVPWIKWKPEDGEPSYDWRERPGSAGNTARVRPLLSLAKLEEALAVRYRTDAHFVSYYLVNDGTGLPLEQQPRVNKAGLPWLLDQGFSVWHDGLFADVDNVPHVKWTKRMLAAFDELWEDPPDVLKTCAAYMTTRGYRLIQKLDEPVTASEYEDYFYAWERKLKREAGVVADHSCHDWTRHMRLPIVTRAEDAIR